jgi:hypothetical protein
MRPRTLWGASFIFFLSILVSGLAKDPVTHSAHTILFEVIEDGALSSKRVALDFDAYIQNGNPWIECRFAVLTINDEKEHVEVDNYNASTDQETINNAFVERDSVSFDMIPFPLAPDRPLRLVASREPGKSEYRVNVVGLWAGLFDKKKQVKIEWRQVQSISLPFPKIER